MNIAAIRDHVAKVLGTPEVRLNFYAECARRGIRVPPTIHPYEPFDVAAFDDSEVIALDLILARARRAPTVELH